MGESKKSGKGSNDVLTSVVVPLVTTVAVPIVSKVIDNTKNIEPKELVEIPALYEKGFPLELAQAVELLESNGFRVTKSKLIKSDAHAKYRNCLDTQVIDSNPKQKKKVKPGTVICLRYITSEVIEESQKIYDAVESAKQEEQIKKQKIREERKNRNKEKFSKVTGTVKNSVQKVVHRTDKKEAIDMEGETENE